MQNLANSTTRERGRLVIGFMSTSGVMEQAVNVRSRKGVGLAETLALAVDQAKRLRMQKYVAGRTSTAEVVQAPAKIVKTPKAAKAPVQAKERQRGKKVGYADGTVWYRADRKKWIGQMHGRQMAARDTAEAAAAYLTKHYSVKNPTILR